MWTVTGREVFWDVMGGIFWAVRKEHRSGEIQHKLGPDRGGKTGKEVITKPHVTAGTS